MNLTNLCNRVIFVPVFNKIVHYYIDRIVDAILEPHESEMILIFESPPPVSILEYLKTLL